MTTPRKPSQPKSDAAIRAQALIEARLTFLPAGCEIPPNFQAGIAKRTCPLLAQCQALPPDADVLCQVSDAEAGVDWDEEKPDQWLSATHEPLRPIDPAWLAVFNGTGPLKD